MTRQEEIKEARHEWYLRTQDADFCAGFQKGAEWADRTMIEKACEWLEENAYIYCDYGGALHESTLIGDFRHVMKGGEQ